MEELSQLNLIKDEEHLRLLVIFHWIYGILKIFSSFIAVVYIYLFRHFIYNPNFYSNLQGSENLQIPPSEVIGFIVAIVKVMMIIGCLVGISNLISAQFIKKRVNKTFSIVVACVNCVFLPLGTVLGVFTLIVLFRNSVIKLYNSTTSEI